MWNLNAFYYLMILFKSREAEPSAFSFQFGFRHCLYFQDEAIENAFIVLPLKKRVFN